MVAPLRILAVSHSANRDGAEQVLLETLTGLQRRGHAVQAVLPGQGPLSVALEKAGVAVVFQPLPWWILPPGQLDAAHLLTQLGPQVEQLRATARAFGAQLIHSSTSVVIHGALAAALEGVPHLWQVHEMLGEPAAGLDPTLGPSATWQLLARLCSGPAGGRLVVASDAMQSLAAPFLPPTSPLTVLPHGHDLRAYLALPAYAPTSAGASPAGPPLRGGPNALAPARTDKLRLVVIASVTPRKGLDLLIRAVDEQVVHGPRAATAASTAGAAFTSSGDLPPFTIEIIGAAHDRAYLKELQALAKARKVAKYFTWSGYCDDLPARLRTARAVVHPSRNDPSPVGLVLAMAAARPIVATRCGGPEKMLVDGVSGRLIPVDDVAALGAEIRRLLTDAAYGQGWGPAARTQAQATWSLDTYLDRLEALYRDLAPSGAAVAAAPRPPLTLDPALIAAILDALHRHAGAVVSDLKQLTPRQQKALNGIVKSAKVLKKTLPASLYNKLANLW